MWGVGCSLDAISALLGRCSPDSSTESPTLPAVGGPVGTGSLTVIYRHLRGFCGSAMAEKMPCCRLGNLHFWKLPTYPELDINSGERCSCPRSFLASRQYAPQSFAMKLAPIFVAAVLFAAPSLIGAVPVGSQEVKKESAERLFLLRLGPDVDPVWKTEEEKWELKKAGVGFMDVTETWAGMQSNPIPQKGSIAATCTSYRVGCEAGSVSHIP